MAEQLTPQQAQAVTNRGGKLLVSAAAGSGKTKVLVDRLMGYLTDPQDPANIDEFLIITYTKAAASELRGKIAAKLSERIAQEPENRHLQQQLQRLYMTPISTVHAFCGEILRQFAYRLDLSADFRTAEENECAQIRDAVMQQVLENAYDTTGEDADFCAFVDTQGIGRDDRQLPQILLKVYDSARCHLDPEAWLDACLQAVNTEGLHDVSQTLWGRYLMEQLFAYLDLQIKAMERCAVLAAEAEGGESVAVLLRDTIYQLTHLRESRTWDEIVARKNIDYGTMRFKKDFTDEDLKLRLKAIRDGCKDGVKRALRPFSDPSEQVLADLASSGAAVRGMVALVRSFGKEYDLAKRRRRILDFSDLEHRALDLLLGKHRSAPTAVAREIGGRYREVMVDEYQDSNAVQDAIYGALTEQRQNCFLVGDVKQSIYQFRLADPGIFLEKYASFVPADQAQEGQGRKVMLSRNFRSGGAVLAAANCVFRRCMSPEVGGLYYGADEALYEGVPHEPLGDAEVEFYGVQIQENTYPEEAAFVARRIKELLDGKHMVRGKEGLRPIVPEDIMILLRSPNSVAEYYRQALEREGIRCGGTGGGDLLQTREICVLRSILQAVHNPQLDIPLLAAMASPVFGFTADDLAAIRAGKRGSSVYDALRKSDSEKVQRFLSLLTKLRREARMETVSRVLETVFNETRIDSIFASMNDGALREANLRTFYELAAAFEAGGQKDLGRFLDYLDAMEEKGLMTATENTNAGCVGIMSIHKSKGLEFPVVFLCGLGRQFNQESKRAPVMCHKELGIGILVADSGRRVRYPTVARRAISAITTADCLSEEMRVLYVAMTRARDRLIMTYSSDDLEKEVTNMVIQSDMDCQALSIREVSCPGEWVLLSALHRAEATELFALGGRPEAVETAEHPWAIRVVEAPEVSAGGEATVQEQTLPADAVSRLAQGLQFQYPHLAATAAPSKQTATQRKGRVKDQEAAENAQEPKPWHRSWRKPAFVEQATQGKARGSATHLALQYIRFECCGDTAALEAEVARLVQEGFLSAQQGEMVECDRLARFFATPLGEKLRTSQNVLREFKFSVLDDGQAFDEALHGEKILLQGVVDCALMEPDGITVVDFKTDRVSENTIDASALRYRPQVEAYADALSRIFEKNVKGKYLYFFHLDRLIEL
ncbi:MAG: helicase-exonuclease AddAB subunit AddA [Oscillospiraceae bacterium]|nr:helicase-exonuclease AddAB subunit AddA [Oscillospiraceae bacterium]